MDDYSTDENHLKHNSQASSNSKKIKKVRKQKSNNESLTNSTEQPNTKSKRKVKKSSNRQSSTDKFSDLSSGPPAIDITNSMSTDQNSFTKYHGHRPSTSESFQINYSDLQTESSFSSDLSQKVPGKLTKKDLSESQKRAIQNVKPVESLSENIDIQVSVSDVYSYTSEDSQKQSSKSKGKKKVVKRRLASSQNNSENTSNRKSNISTESEKDKLQNPQDFLAKQPRRRGFFDRDDIDGKRKAAKIPSNPSTGQTFSDEYSLSDYQNRKSRSINVKDEDSMFTINSSSLLSTNSDINYKDELDISQTPLPNEESFKKLQSNAILSIKSTNPREKSKSLSLDDEIPTDLETTTTTGLTESNLSQVQKSDFKEQVSKAIKEVKEVSLDDVSFDSHSLDFTDEIKKEDNISNDTSQQSETRSISDPKLNSKSAQEKKSNENSLYSTSIEEEEEEDDNVAVDSLTQSQMNQTVDILSDEPQNNNNDEFRNAERKPSHAKEDSDIQENINPQNNQLNSSDQFFNSEVTDDQALRVVKSKVDNLVIPESTRAYMNKGIRMRPKEDDTGAAYGQLSLPDKNDELQFDSEISELDVEIDTDKKKFKKSIVSKTPTNRIPSSIPSVDRRRNKKNKFENDNYNQRSRNNFNDPSNIEYSDFPSFLSSDTSDNITSRDINIDGIELIQEDSMMYPTQFDVQQANSDDEGSLFERFKRNANLLSSSSSDEQNTPSLPTKARSTPNDSVTEVVENTYTEIDSISGSSGNSKRHKDKTVTKGKITLYNLSSSSSFDDLDEDLDLDMQERGIKNEFSIDNDVNDDNNNKPRTDKFSSRPASTKTQNCYFDGNVVLKLTVVEAKDLPQEEFTPLDPYCTVALSDKKKIQKTKTIRSTTRPIWDQQFIFNYNIHKLASRSNPPSTPIFRNAAKQNGIFLYIQVINEDKFGGDREISSAQLDLKDVKISQYIDQWIKLKPSGNYRTGGEIRLNLFVEPQTPISTFSPRKTKFNNNDDSDYLLSPRSQTPSAQYNPFGESTKRRQTGTAKTYFNSNSGKKPQEAAKVSQTPNINYSQRPWTDSESSEASAIVETRNKKDQNEAATFTLADNIDEEEEEEESIAYSDLEEEIQDQIKSNDDDDDEEEQNGYHTEIKPGVQQRRSNRSNKNDYENGDNDDKDLLANQDDPDDLSPIERTVREDDDDGNSLNFNSLTVGEVKRRTVDDFHQEEDENENSYYEDEEEDGDINSQMSSLSSGNVDDKLGELDTY